MQVVQGKPITQYSSQTNGTMIKKSGGKTIVVEADEGDEEEIEETQTIIKKTIIRRKGKNRTYVRFEKFKRKKSFPPSWDENAMQWQNSVHAEVAKVALHMKVSWKSYRQLKWHSM